MTYLPVLCEICDVSRFAQESTALAFISSGIAAKPIGNGHTSRAFAFAS